MPLGQPAASEAQGGKANPNHRKETLQATAQPPLEKMGGDIVTELRHDLKLAHMGGRGEGRRRSRTPPSLFPKVSTLILTFSLRGRRNCSATINDGEAHSLAEEGGHASERANPCTEEMNQPAACVGIRAAFPAAQSETRVSMLQRHSQFPSVPNTSQTNFEHRTLNSEPET